MAELIAQLLLDDSDAKKKIKDLKNTLNASIAEGLTNSGKNGLNGMADEAKKAASGIDVASDANKRLKEAQLANIEALRQARVELAKQLKSQSDLNNQYTQGKIDLQTFRHEQAKLNAIRREEARQARETKKALSENREYNKLTAELNRLRNATKDTLAEMVRLERQGQKNSTSYRELTNRTREMVANTNQLDKAVKKIDITVGQHQRNVGNYGDAISMVAPQLSQFAGKLGLVAAAVAGVNQTFNSNLRMEPITQSLKFASGSSEEFQKNIDFLRESADRLGLEFISTATSFKLWQGAAKFSNLTADESRKIFESVANASAKMKLSNDQVQGTFLALSQMMSKGKVQAEELRGQLGERLPGAFSLAAKAMGLTEAELNKMLEKGEVLAQDFLPRFANQLDTAFGNEKTERIQGMQASVNRLKNEFDALWQSEKASKFFSTISDGLATLTSNFNKFVNSGSVKEFFVRFAGVFSSNLSQQAMARAMGDAVSASDNNQGNEKRGVVSYKEMASFYDLTREKQKEVIKNQEEIYKHFQKEYQLHKSQKNLDNLNWNAEKLAKMRSAIGVDPVITPIKKNPGNDKSEEKASEKIRQAVERQRSLQMQIDALAEKSTRKQISRDEEEIESIRDKYAKIREAVDKFYRDPKNKGQKVNTSGLDRAEKFEISEANTRQETITLMKDLTAKKALYDEYNNHVSTAGVKAADERYKAELSVIKNFESELKEERLKISTLEKTASLAGFKGTTAELTQAQRERDDKLSEIEKDIANKKRERENQEYAEALQLAMGYSDDIIALNIERNKRITDLGKTATQEQINNINKYYDEEISALTAANIQKEVEWDKSFENMVFMSKKATDKILDDIQARLDAKLKAGKLTKEDHRKMSTDVNSAKVQNNLDKSWIASKSALDSYRASLKKYGKESDETKRAQSDMFSALARDLSAATSLIGDASGLLGTLGASEGLQETVNQIGALTDGLSNLASGIASGNPVAIVSGAIKTLTAAIDLFNRKDKNIQKQIARYQDQLDGLEQSFSRLDKQINNSIGESFYSNSEGAIANLKQQQRLFESMAKAEEAKKKTDKNKVQEYRNGIRQIDDEINGIEMSMKEMRLQTSVKELAKSVTDALVSAFESGADAIEATDKVFDQFIKNALANSLMLKHIEPIIEDMLSGLDKYMAANGNSLVGFDFESYKKKIQGASDILNGVMDQAYAGLGLDKIGAGDSEQGIAGRISRSITEGNNSDGLGITSKKINIKFN